MWLPAMNTTGPVFGLLWLRPRRKVQTFSNIDGERGTLCTCVNSTASVFHITTFSRAVPQCTGAAMFCLCLNEFSGVVLSCFTLSRQTSWTEVLITQPEDSLKTLFKAIVYSKSWVRKFVTTFFYSLFSKNFTGYLWNFRCQCKVVTLANLYFEGSLPPYLSSSLCTYEPFRSLRS